VQSSNDIAASALRRLPSNSGRHNQDGSMRKISDTIARLAALQAQHTARTPDHGAPARLSTLTGFGSNPGALKARSYLPKHLPEGAPMARRSG
jgi:poly(3-hydroxybutyrate) depolymerase